MRSGIRSLRRIGRLTYLLRWGEFTRLNSALLCRGLTTVISFAVVLVFKNEFAVVSRGNESGRMPTLHVFLSNQSLVWQCLTYNLFSCVSCIIQIVPNP